MMRVLFLLFCLTATVQADIRVNLISRLNVKIDDANNVKLTQAQKISILDAVGSEVGAWTFIKTDTILTVANTETYATNSDFAGVLRGAYVKSGQERQAIQVVDFNKFADTVTPIGNLRFIYVVQDERVGFQDIPTRQDTVILSYFATAAALSADSTEWDIPDKYEDAALEIAASKCLDKVATEWAHGRSRWYFEKGWSVIQQSKIDMAPKVQAGDAR